MEGLDDIAETAVVSAPAGDHGRVVQRCVLTDTGPCQVCGRIFGSMPKKCMYCWEHKRTVDAMTLRCRQQDQQQHEKVVLGPGE